MKKHLFLILSLVVLTLSFSLVISATEVQNTVVEPNITVSADSVYDIIDYEVGYDAILDSNVLTLSVEKFGVCIYDNPDTTYIDGIRFNGETVNSLKIPIDVTKQNKIVIRTAYKDDFTGTLAQMSDGTYDYTNFLTNPVGALVTGYYILAFILALGSVIAIFTGKKKKVKTSEEIANTVDTRAAEAFATLSNKISEVLTPFVQSMYDTQETIVEAIVLMNSKDPNSHLEALECLKRVASTDVTNAISNIGDELKTVISYAQDHKHNAIESLTNIAETAQEESANVQPPIL